MISSMYRNPHHPPKKQEYGFPLSTYSTFCSNFYSYSMGFFLVPIFLQKTVNSCLYNRIFLECFTIFNTMDVSHEATSFIYGCSKPHYDGDV